MPESGFFADVFRYYPDPLFVKDLNFRYTFVNEAFSKFVGVASDKLIGKDDFQVIPEPVAFACRAADAKTIELSRTDPKHLPYETDEIFSDLEGERILRVRRYILRDRNGNDFLFGAIRDVTDIIRNEAILKETLTDAQIGSFEYRSYDGQATWSDGMFRILGFDPGKDPASNDSFLSLILPEDVPDFYRAYERAVERKDRSLSLEYRIRRKNDEAVRWIRTTGRIQYEAKGIIYFGTSQDVTDFKTSETKRRETENRLGQFVEMIDEVVWSVVWGSWLPIYQSPTVERIYGWSMPDLMRVETWTSIFPTDEIQRMYRDFEFAAMSGVDSFSGEYKFFHRNGQERIAFIRGKVFRDEEGKPIRLDGLTSDVTEMRRAIKELEEHRQKLFALSKLNTLGELASGIGHEINTPLSGILSKIARAERFISERKEEPSEREAASRLLREAMGIVERVSQIVDGLKQLSQDRRNDEVEVFDPSTAIDQALSLSRARFSNHGFRVEFVRPATPLQCQGNVTTLFQALVNLLNNAFDALDERQEKSGHDGSEGVFLSVSNVAGGVSIRVKDSGAGISESFKPKLFEAFQTTKPEGKGTGLGLNISRRLLRSHGGDLRLIASAPRNTEFEIVLPTPK